MPYRNKPISGWGNKYTAFQLSDALQNNRNEFLELCRRVTCDEIAATRLVGLVEKILDSGNSDESSENLDEKDLLEAVKINKRCGKKQDSSGFNAADREPREIEEATNLIQLLAEVHMMSMTKNGRRAVKSRE